MPSKSPAQAKLMRAVAHDPAFAAKVNVPQSVGKDYTQADKAKPKPTPGKLATALKGYRG